MVEMKSHLLFFTFSELPNYTIFLRLVSPFYKLVLLMRQVTSAILILLNPRDLMSSDLIYFVPLHLQNLFISCQWMEWWNGLRVTISSDVKMYCVATPARLTYAYELKESVPSSNLYITRSIRRIFLAKVPPN